MIDTRQDTPSYAANGAYGLSASTMAWFLDHYLGLDGARDDWRVAPLRVEDLQGLPPAVIVAAERLRGTGDEVDLTIEPGMPHGFWGMPVSGATASLHRNSATVGRQSGARP